MVFLRTSMGLTSRASRIPNSTSFRARVLFMRSNSSSPASVRISSDLAIKSQCLRHSAALRIVDNHLHTTHLLPRPHENPMVDIFCVGQTVTTYRDELLLDRLHDPQQQSKIQSHVWLAKVGEGASLTFGGAVTMADTDIPLALCSRVFLRVDAQTHRPIRITDSERKSKFVIEKDCDGTERFGRSIPEVSPISWDSTTSPAQAGDEMLRVQVGPQHINHGDHVDHAFLADTACHALFLSNKPKSGMDLLTRANQSTLRVQYIAQGYLGETLTCYVKTDVQEGAVSSVWGKDDAGKMQLKTLAEWY
mmetsp:Transcript_6103/g.9349  ORF Transcript_6103/g.9349 Transcript_6103/m.9349 type:complete len:306 (+) Transcript_6103:284-1201(+)